LGFMFFRFISTADKNITNETQRTHDGRNMGIKEDTLSIEP